MQTDDIKGGINMKIITNKSKRIILVGVLALILGSLAYLWIVNNSIKHMPMFASYAKGYRNNFV